MLGVLRAVIPGAAFAQTWPNLVSLWTFDEVGGPTFGDSGQANVPMTIVGTWADLSTTSMIEGVGGTSAYTDGSGYATIPAGIAQHDLAALTISFYYQRNSAAAKHILLAAGDGTQVGDLSIEVLANGRLRGYHRGQDGVLRFFESSNGITGTNLQVGTAHRIDLTLGPLGARIYLDGIPLTQAFILGNTNSWNNARIKHLGIFPGEVGPADGAFDGLRLWDQQLNSAQIATLEPARSITLPGEVDLPQELSVPSLAEWLISDETDPTPTKFVSNQNRGNGSGSSPANAQEVQAALNGASPGQTFLAVCQTPGTIEFWNYPNGLTFPNGSSNNYITLQARQGDGVVISAGQDWAGSRTANSGFWTQSGLSQADIDNKIWRSTNAVGGAESMMGWWLEFGHPHQIIRASNMTNLRAAFSDADSPGGYAGPSVHKDTDGRVYIRFQRPHPAKYSRSNKWSENTFDGHPEAVNGGQLVYPISENPNSYIIHLCRAANVKAFNASSWAKIGAGINSMGFRHCFKNNSSNIRCDRGLHLTWHNFIETSVSGAPVSNYFMNRVRCSDGSKLHLSRSEWKFGGWLEPIRTACFQMFNSNTMSHIYWKDCTIGHYHEICVGANNLNHVRMRNCTFVNILDDGFQTLHNMSRVEVGWCYYYNSAWGGFGEGGAEDQEATPGNWFLHHNIIDYRQERGTNWRAQPHPGFLFSPHSPNGNNPKHIYNNLFIWGPDSEEEVGPGLQHSVQDSGGDNTLTGTLNMHEVFNNIIMRAFLEGTKRYDPVVTSPSARYSDNFQDRSDFVLGRTTRYGAGFSNELFDYNLYWRPPGMAANALFRGHHRGGSSAKSDYASLAAWKGSSEFEHSKLSGSLRGAYAPGFDGNSTETKPTLPSIDNYPADRFKYRPSATSEVTTATTSSLGGANWWSTPPTWGTTHFPWNDGEKTLAPSAWKGALDPGGTTSPVGVQNP
jgi:hypothetical protein